MKFFRRHTIPAVRGLPDDDLCAMIATGNHRESEAAFTELYGRYARRIHAYCVRIVTDPQDAEDVFQETFIRFHHTLRKKNGAENGEGDPPPSRNTSGLLFTIARNLCLNQKQRNIRWKTEQVESDMLHAWDKPYEQKEMVELITTALELLPHDYREAFVLREYDGLPYNEIAELTGASLATAKIRVFRAKEKLRKILEPYLRDSQVND
ncbi:MAG: RNA polymerase sigma factor [Chlorobi bacterium]|nr:RNA polymerase sigma factor [Chlorobiota bacterium]